MYTKHVKKKIFFLNFFKSIILQRSIFIVIASNNKYIYLYVYKHNKRTAIQKKKTKKNFKSNNKSISAQHHYQNYNKVVFEDYCLLISLFLLYLPDKHINISD